MKRAGSNRFAELSDQADQSSSAEMVGNGSRKKKKKKGQNQGIDQGKGEEEPTLWANRNDGRGQGDKKAVSTANSNDINSSNSTIRKYVDRKSIRASGGSSPFSSERLSDYDIIDNEGDNSETTSNTADSDRDDRIGGSNYTGTIVYHVVGKGNLDPYEVRKDLTHALKREVVNITADRGSIKVDYITLNEMESLRRLTSLAGREVRVRETLKPSEPITQLIIFDVPISLTNEIIKESCDSMSVHRIARKSGEERLPTTSVVLTYSKVNAPSEVKIQYLRFKTRTYVREPVRCFNCQIFGHVAKYCFRPARCAKCCGRHDTRKCSSSLTESCKCASCESVAHTTGHKDCPSRVRATTLAQTVAKEGVTYAQAAQGYNSPKLITVTKTQEQSTQTQEQNKPMETRQGGRGKEKSGNLKEDKIREWALKTTRAAKEISEENSRSLLKHQANTARQLKNMISGVWRALLVVAQNNKIEKLLMQTELDRLRDLCREHNEMAKTLLDNNDTDFNNLPRETIETKAGKITTSEGGKQKRFHGDKDKDKDKNEDEDENENKNDEENEDEILGEINNEEENEDEDMDNNEEDGYEDEEGEEDEKEEKT